MDIEYLIKLILLIIICCICLFFYNYQLNNKSSLLIGNKLELMPNLLINRDEYLIDIN